MQLTPDEIEASDEQLRRAVLTLWQTNLLRRTKLTVLDEVANGLSFYDYTFLREVPRLLLRAGRPACRQDPHGGARTSWRRSCGWEAGSAATATAIRSSRQTCARHAAAAERSRAALLSGRAARAGRASCRWPAASCRCLARNCARLADRSPDRSPHRQRRTLSPRHLRHLCAPCGDRHELDHVEALRHAVGEAPPYASGAEFKADLDVIHRSLTANNSAIARGRLRASAPRGGLFRLPSGRPGPAAELRRARAHDRRAVRGRGAGHALSGAGRGRAHRAARCASCATRAPAASRRSSTIREETQAELALFRAAAMRTTLSVADVDPELHHLEGPTACPTCWKSRCC